MNINNGPLTDVTRMAETTKIMFLRLQKHKPNKENWYKWAIELQFHR
jgi:hypothetical protein